MPGIAIKYWAFQQTGWGHVDETAPVPEPPPTPTPTPIPGRTDSGAFPFYPVRVLRPSITYIDRGFPQNLELFDQLREDVEYTAKVSFSLSFFDYVTTLLAAIESATVALSYPALPAKGLGEVFFDLVDRIDTFGLFQEIGNPGLYAREEIGVVNISREEFSAHSQLLHSLPVWQETQLNVNSFHSAAQVVLPFIYEKEETGEREDDLEEILPAIIARFLEELDLSEDSEE